MTMLTIGSRLSVLAKIIFFWSIVTQSIAMTLNQDITCTISNADSLILQSGAQAVMSGLLSIHKSGQGGYGCGAVNKDSIQAFEAMRWSLELLNKKNLTFNTERLTTSYVPGVKIGMLVSDTCMSSTHARSAAAKLYPRLPTSVSKECSKLTNKISLGLIEDNPNIVSSDIHELASQYSLPLISFSSKVSRPRAEKSVMRTALPLRPLLLKATSKLLKQLKWTRVVVIHTDDKLSTESFQHLVQLTSSQDICLVDIRITENTSENSLNVSISRIVATGVVGVIFIGPNHVAKALVGYAPNVPQSGRLQWVFVDSMSITNIFHKQKYQRGSIVVVPATRKIAEFEDHWVRLNAFAATTAQNRWYKEWYASEFSCTLPSCPQKSESEMRSTFVQDPSVEPAIMSVYTYANALKNAHADKCGSRPGLCSDLLNMKRDVFIRDYISKVDFVFGKAERVSSLASHSLDPYGAPKHLSFHDNGDIVNNACDVFHFNSQSGIFKYRNIGTYFESDDQLHLNAQNLRMYNADREKTLSQIPISGCPVSGCTQCATVANKPRHHYMHGDLILNSIVSIHNAGEIDATCGGDVNIQSVTSVEAMIHAIKYINNMNSLSGERVLNGVRLGLLVMDSCQSSMLGQTQAEGVRTGLMKVQSANGDILDQRNIIGYTADSKADTSVAFSKFINRVKKPHLNFDVSSTELSDVSRFPWFLRTVPSDAKLIETIVALLKRIGWRHIQVIYESDAYGQRMLTEITNQAGKAGICVVASLMPSNDDFSHLVKKLRINHNVRPVVSFVKNVRMLLEAVKAESADQEFIFIGSHSWRAINFTGLGLEQAANGSLIVEPEELEFPLFYSYLDNLNASTYNMNPWFKEWYSKLFNCSFTDSFIDRPKCGAHPVTSSAMFKKSQYSSYAIAAIYALVTGLHETLKEICGPNYNGVCGDFRNRVDTSRLLLKHLKQASFYFLPPSVTKRTEFSMINGQAAMNFVVYRFSDTANYQKVAEFDHKTATLTWTDSQSASVLETIQSSCPGLCTECMYIFSYQRYMHISGDVTIGAILDLHTQGPSPFACSETLHRHGFIKTAAIQFALNVINSGQSGSIKLNNVRLGALVIDGCENHLRSSNLLSRFIGSSGLNIAGLDGQMYIGWMTDNSRSTIDAGDLLKKLDMALISPGARSPVLDDKTRFSTFYRTATSDGKIIEGMIKMAAVAGFRYVAVLNTPDHENRAARDRFIREAKGRGVCVATSREFVTHGDYEKIAREILQSGTDIVVVFGAPFPHVAEYMKSTALSGVTRLRYMSNYGWTRMLDETKKWHLAQYSLTFERKRPELTMFEEYLRNLTLPLAGIRNPWFNEFYENTFKCRLNGNPKYNKACASNPSEQIVFDSKDSSILSTFDAVYAYAAAIHDTLKQLCGDQYNSVCGAFYTSNDTYRLIVEKLDRSVTFSDAVHLNSPTFDFVKKESNRHTEVKMVKGEKEELVRYLETMRESDMSALARNYAGAKATCVGTCAQCETISKTSDEFVYVPGDIIIGGLFDVHKPGTTPYNCGSINENHGLELSEAFLFALDYVNNHRGIFKNKLPGVTLGGLMFDVCQQPSRAGNLVANIHSGNKQLTKNGNHIPANRIDLYVGPFSTDSSIRVADVLDVLGIPMISYGATSMELQDPFKYRYFLRSVPADDKQARGIVSFLKFSQINYVQTIYSYNSVGEKGRQEFVRLANLNGICVTANHIIGKGNATMETQVRDAVSKLLDNRQAATVILFVDEPLIVLQAAEGNPAVAGSYLMIGTDKWGIDLKLSSAGLNRVLKNAITFDVESADIPEFDAYLDNKTPKTYKTNPWFEEYYQYIYNCSSTNVLRLCKPSLFGISRSERYVQDTYALYVINAVFSAALGIHSAIEGQCPRFDHACDKFIKSGERRQLILSGIKSARFIDSTTQPFYYTSLGESDRGYHIYSIEKGTAGSYKYNNLGSYNDTHFLKIDYSYQPSWKSRCNADASQCKNCDFAGNQPSRFQLNTSIEDLNIIGIFNIHARKGRFECGEIDLHHGFQNMLAFHYAMDEINRNRDRNQRATLKLGGLALDTCSNPARLGQDIYSLLSGEALCSDLERGQLLPPATVMAYLTMGSENSVVASNILSPRKVTTFSPSATSVELSDKQTHSHFLRAVPPDDQQANVMISILKKFAFSYASAVYSADNYGRDSKRQLLQSAYGDKKSVCIAKTIEMQLDASEDDAVQIVTQLQNILGSKVVILFLTHGQTRLLLKAARDLNLVGRFIWLGSERWGNDENVVKDLNEISTGAITLQIHSAHVQGFQKYMEALSLDNHGPLPRDWFEEFYQSAYKCRIVDSLRSKNFPRVCDGSEKADKSLQLSQDRSVLHTIITMNMIAQGMQDVEVCSRSPLNLAGCLDLQPNKRQLIFEKIRDAQWRVLPNQLNESSFSFSLTKEGYGNIRYNIYNYMRNGTAATFMYQQIGYWERGNLEINIKNYHSLFSSGSKGVIPASLCPSGTRSTCEAPGGGTYDCTTSRFSGSSGTQGARSGTISDAQIAESFDANFDIAARFVDAWGIIVSVLATIGAFMTLCLFIYLLVVYPIRSGTSILGFFLIFGIIIMFLMVFPFILHANDTVCGIRRFGVSFSYCICFAALFVKLIDCWRNRKKGDISDVKYEKLGRPIGLLFIAIFLVIIQVLVNAEWLGFQSPTSVLVNDEGDIWRRCAPVEDAGVMLMYDKGLALSMIYVHILIVLCFIFCCVTWKVKTNRHEARWIFVAVLFTIPCVVLWAVVSCIMPIKYRDAAVAIGVLFNAYVLFTFVPLRKLYLYSKFHSQLEISEEVEKLSHSTKGDPYSLGSSMYGHRYDNTPRYHDDSGSQSRRHMSFTGY